MRTKNMPRDMSSIEDTRPTVRPTRKLKTDREDAQTVAGYKEDPQTVRDRLLISDTFQNAVKGKTDRQNSPESIFAEVDKRAQQRYGKKK